MTLAALRERMRQGLEQIFKSPFVTVTPLFRMAVLGQVRNPGLYTVDPAFSVLDNSRLSSLVGPIPEWTDALDRYLVEKGHRKP